MLKGSIDKVSEQETSFQTTNLASPALKLSGSISNTSSSQHLAASNELHSVVPILLVLILKIMNALTVSLTNAFSEIIPLFQNYKLMQKASKRS